MVLGGALRRDAIGRGNHGQCRCPAAGSAHLRGLLLRLAQPNRQPLHGGAQQHPEVCCVNHTLRAAPVEQFHAPQGRRRRGRGQAQAGAGQGFRNNGQRSAGPVADAAQPRRRVCAADPPADSGIGTPPLPRRRCIRRAPARRHQDDDHRRSDSDLPARRTNGEEDQRRSHALSGPLLRL